MAWHPPLPDAAPALSPWHGLLHVLGVLPVAPGGNGWLNFWGGFGSLSLLGLLVHQVRLHNCRAHWYCPRIGHLREGGRPVCHRHQGQGG